MNFVTLLRSYVLHSSLYIILIFSQLLDSTFKSSEAYTPNSCAVKVNIKL